MNRIEALEDSQFRFTSWSENALLSLKEDDANKLVALLEKAADDLLKRNDPKLLHKGVEIHYKYMRLFFKVEKNYLDIIHLVHIDAVPLNGNMIYEAALEQPKPEEQHQTARYMAAHRFKSSATPVSITSKYDVYEQ